MKKGISFFLIMLSLVLSAFSQAIWTQKASHQGMARVNIIGFAVNDKGYIAGGSFGGLSVTADCQEFNPVSNSWTVKAPMPFAFRAGTGFAAGGKGYTTLGVNEAMFIQDLLEYNTLGNNWSTTVPFPAETRMFASGFGIGAKGYITCGTFINLTPLNDLWEYDQASNTWTQKADLPGVARHNATAFTIGDKGYIFGGTDDMDVLSDLWEYNPATNSWVQKAFLPAGGRTDAVAFSIGNNAYLVGGWPNGGGALSEVWQYNAADNAWVQLANFPGTPAAGGTAFSLSGYGYVVGGYGTTQCWQFDPNTVGFNDQETPSEQINLIDANGSKTLVINSPEASRIRIMISDLIGRLVLTNEFEKPTGQFSFGIDESSLNNGAYIISVYKNGVNTGFAKKMVKVNF